MTPTQNPITQVVNVRTSRLCGNLVIGRASFASMGFAWRMLLAFVRESGSHFTCFGSAQLAIDAIVSPVRLMVCGGTVARDGVTLRTTQQLEQMNTITPQLQFTTRNKSAKSGVTP